MSEPVTARERALIEHAFNLGCERSWEFDNMNDIVEQVLQEVPHAEDPADDEQLVI